MINDIRNALIIWPSWQFLSVGAAPIGILLMPPSYVLWLSSAAKVFLFGFVLSLVINIESVAGVTEFLKLLIGPLVLICAQRSFYIGKGLLYLLIAIFFADAFINTGEFRGGTSLTLEPSHSGRAFYTYLFLLLIYYRPSSLVIIIFGGGFLILNKSTSGALYFIFISVFLLLFIKKIAVQKFFHVIIVLGFFILLIAASMGEIKDSRIAEGLGRLGSIIDLSETNKPLAQALTDVGSRRLSQSLAGYEVSRAYGHGLGVSNEVFMSATIGSKIDLTEVDRITRLGLRTAPASYASQVAFEAGYVSLLLLCAFLFVLLRKNFNTARVLVFSFGLSQLLFFSTTTIPFPWIFMGLACNPYIKYE